MAERPADFISLSAPLWLSRTASAGDIVKRGGQREKNDGVASGRPRRRKASEGDGEQCG